MTSGKAFAVGRLTLLLVSLFAATAAGSSSASPWVRLAKGRLGDYQWSVRIKRPGGRAGAGHEGALRPCLLVGTKWEVGAYSYRRSSYRACEQTPGHLTATEPPLVGSGVQPGNRGAVGFTAIGMVAAPAVKRVRVFLSDGTRQTVPLRRLSRRQAYAAELGRFRYAAFALHGAWCAERVITLNRRGAALWDSGPGAYGCETEGLRSWTQAWSDRSFI